MNTVTIVGNATRDAEIRLTPAGKKVANFGVAVNKRVRQGDEWVDELEGFFDVSAWDRLAENAEQSIRKGTRVIITGRVKQRSWETPEGDKRSAVELNAEDLGLSIRWEPASHAAYTETTSTTGPSSRDIEPF